MVEMMENNVGDLVAAHDHDDDVFALVGFTVPIFHQFDGVSSNSHIWSLSAAKMIMWVALIVLNVSLGNGFVLIESTNSCGNS